MPELAFLAGKGVPQNILQIASRLATANGTSGQQELFAIGFDRSRYWSMLAEHLGVAFASTLEGATLVTQAGPLTTEAVRHASAALVRINGRTMLVLAPRWGEVELLQRRLRRSPALAGRIWIAAPETIRAFIVAHRHAALSHYAINRLARILPPLSARRLWRLGEASGPTALLAAALALGLLAPLTTVKVLGLLSTLFFLNCSLWKSAAALHRRGRPRLELIPNERLPAYTIMVPLYREAAVVADLVRHLRELDYPAAKLQILLILEADDAESRAAVSRHVRSPPFEVLVVPPGGPRTKPKALTYALPFARGEFVVVFDAEDRPEPDQLRKAAALFRERPWLGCVQARLLPDNEGSWYARMFTVEYAVNFEVLLPALAEWGVPLPLGGTSNHFPGIR